MANRKCINNHCNADWDPKQEKVPSSNCQCGYKNYSDCEYYIGHLIDTVDKITESQIESKHTVKVMTCVNIIYKLKDGNYFVNLEEELDNRLPNWGCSLNNVKWIPKEIAEKLIKENSVPI